ncbi:hypothetical protein AOLI_G00009680 [Acnodon oligacanthus]
MGDPSLHRDCPLDCKVYVGNLGNSGNKTELERAFGYYGPLRSVWVARNPPGFAFVEFEDPRDATDAVRELDGRTLCGCRVRVEMSSGEKRSRNRGPPPSWGRRPRDDYRRRSPPPRRRDIMPLLINHCVSQLVQFQHHVTSVHQSAHMTQAWPRAHCLLSMSPRRRSFSRSRSRSLSREKKRDRSLSRERRRDRSLSREKRKDRSLSRDRNHKPSRSLSRSRSRSRSNDR